MTATAPLSSNPWTPYPARIARIKREIPDTTTYELVLADEEHKRNFRFSPGQFNMLYLPGFGESAISISSDPTCRESLSHTIRVAGNVTSALARHQTDDEILLRGPFGTPWPVESCEGCDIVLICGGIGLAPLRPAIYHIINQRDRYRSVSLIYGARTPSGLLYQDEYDAWRERGIEVDLTVDRAEDYWSGNIGVVTALLHRMYLDAEHTRVFTCGPEIMMRFVALEALSQQVSPQHVFVSLERNMQCAVGFCGHCQLGPAFICRDGPVFTYEQMEPYLRLDDL